MDVTVIMYYVTVITVVLHSVILKVEPFKPKWSKTRREEDDDVTDARAGDQKKSGRRTEGGGEFTWGNYEGEEWEVIRLKKLPARRHRRHLSSSSVAQVEQYRFRGFGRHFHLRLKVNNQMLSPHFATYRNTANGTLESVPTDACHHLIGRLQGNRSVAAISRCPLRGMTGYIRTSQDYFYLEPALPKHRGGRGRAGTEEDGRYILHRKAVDNTQGNIFQTNKNKQTKTNSRVKRAASSKGAETRKKTVEVLLVMDKTMIQRHGNTAAATLAFTVFNMVSALFSDNSIGLPIRLVLVSLLLLEHEQQGLSVSMDAKHLLHHFCQWQASLLSGQESDEEDDDEMNESLISSNVIGGHRHDHAVLITALNFCAWKSEPCDTLGYAPIRGMCQSRRSCSVTKDTGLSVAYTIAHEIGHNFGMVHDGDEEHCPLGSGHLMAPSLQPAAYGQFLWSDCSRRELENFLTMEQSFCLNDQPTGRWRLLFPSVLPGEIYDANSQCQLQFGKKSTKCPLNFVKSMCQMLWCQIDDKRCETKYLPAAEGTQCEAGKWCRKGKCVMKGDHGPPPIDGHWSQWSSWSSCTRTCGGGIRRRIRKCDNPKSQYGGKYCEGNSTEHQMCNSQACPGGGQDIRSIQCASFNQKPFRGHYYTWTAYTEGLTGNSRCKLYCKAKGWDFVASLTEKVLDGTPCNSNSNPMLAMHNNNSISEKQFQESSYYVDVQATADVCVDGRCRKVGCEGRLDSHAAYDRCGVCDGDSTSCIKSLAISRHSTENPCSDWSRCSHSRWLINEWSPCIGCQEGRGGFQKRKVSCYLTSWNGSPIAATNQMIGRRNCEIKNGPRPIRKRNCRCPPRWQVNEWQMCSVQMATGNNDKCGLGVKTRKVNCQQWYESTDEVIADDKCTGSELPNKPITSLPCRVPCRGRWVTHAWGQCSVSCGSGWRSRRVTCVPSNNLSASTIEDASSNTCSIVNKPKSLMHCQAPPCQSFGPFRTLSMSSSSYKYIAG